MCSKVKGNVIVKLIIVPILKIMVEVNFKSVFCRNSQYYRNNVPSKQYSKVRRGGKYFQIVLFLYYCIVLNLKPKYMNIVKKLCTLKDGV